MKFCIKKGKKSKHFKCAIDGNHEEMLAGLIYAGTHSPGVKDLLIEAAAKIEGKELQPVEDNDNDFEDKVNFMFHVTGTVDTAEEGASLKVHQSMEGKGKAIVFAVAQALNQEKHQEAAAILDMANQFNDFRNDPKTQLLRGLMKLRDLVDKEPETATEKSS